MLEQSQEVAQSLLHYLDAGMSTRFGVVPIRSAASPAAAAAGGGGAPEEDPPAVSAPKDEPAAAKKVSVAFEKLSAEYGTKAAMHFLAACAAARGVDTKTGVAGPLSEAAASKVRFLNSACHSVRLQQSLRFLRECPLSAPCLVFLGASGFSGGCAQAQAQEALSEEPR